MQNTCSQLAFSLKISCFHFRPREAAHMPKSLLPLPSYSSSSSRRCTSSRCKLCTIISSDHLSQCSTTHTATKKISVHVYVKGWLLAKFYIMVYNVKFSPSIERKIIFPFMRSRILLFVHSFTLGTSLITNAVYNPMFFFKKAHNPNPEMLKKMNYKVGAAGQYLTFLQTIHLSLSWTRVN